VAGHRQADGNGEAVFSERWVGPFQRTVELPADVDPERATAQLVAGLLILHLPKR
jgi:HSP20 family molecular chaperone IbpA